MSAFHTKHENLPEYGR